MAGPAAAAARRGAFEARPHPVASVATMLVLFLLSGVFMQILAVSAPAIALDWGVDFTALAAPMAAVLIGSGIGTVLGGLLADRFGRRPLILLCLLGMGALEGVASVQSGTIGLFVTILIAGIAMGAYYAASLALITELVPPRRTALIISLSVASIPAGLALCAAMAAFIVPEFGWETLFRVAALASLPAALAFALFVPESPGFLARDSLRREEYLRAAGSLGLEIEDQAPPPDAGDPAPPRGLFANTIALIGDRPATTIGIAGLFFGTYIFGNAVINWVPVALTNAGFGQSFTSGSLTAWSMASLAATPLVGWLLMRLGIKVVMLASTIIAMTAVALLGSFAMQGEGTEPVMLVALALGGLSSAGIVVSLITLVAETFPPHQRGSGMGLSDALGRIGGVLAAYFGAHVITLGGAPAFFAALAALMAVVALYIAFLHPFPARARR